MKSCSVSRSDVIIWNVRVKKIKDGWERRETKLKKQEKRNKSAFFLVLSMITFV